MALSKPIVFDLNTGKIRRLSNSDTIEGIYISKTKTNLNDLDILNNREQIFLNSSTSSFSLYLPSQPSIGDTIKIIDAYDCSINNITIYRNSELIKGVAEDLIIDIKGINLEFLYVSGSIGWNIVI